MKASERLRLEASLGNSVYQPWPMVALREAADLLDECEMFMGRTEEKDLDVCSPEWWTEFYRLFAKLRAAQEKADE